LTDWFATILVGITIAVGIAGVILPIFPGIWLIWGASLVYGLLVGFDVWGWLAMAAITGLAAIGTGIIYYLPAKKTGEVGMPGWGQLVVAGCAVVGFFIVPIVGAILGVIVGTLAVALVVEGHLGRSMGTASTMLIEILKASAIQLGIALLMAVIWGLWAVSVIV
jgi:uncharacterized protein YqgC (DUF456 family)